MRIHTGVGTTPTILVIVVTIGDGRYAGANGPCAALRARPARVSAYGRERDPGHGRDRTPRERGRSCMPRGARRWACRGSRAACGERPVTAGRDGTTACAATSSPWCVPVPWAVSWRRDVAMGGADRWSRGGRRLCPKRPTGRHATVGVVASPRSPPRCMWTWATWPGRATWPDGARFPVAGRVCRDARASWSTWPGPCSAPVFCRCPCP